jgi:Cdc6-like AAA superfamily ATPase
MGGLTAPLVSLYQLFLEGGIAMLHDGDVSAQAAPLASALIPHWLSTLPLAPLLTVLAELWSQLEEIINGRPIAALLQEERQAHAIRDRQATQQAEHDAKHPPRFPAGTLGLGSYVVGKIDQFPPHIGVHTQQHWLGLSEAVLDQHLFILGAPGAGKSETIKRLIWEVLQQTDRDVFLVDGKGEEPLARDVRALAYHTGRGNSPIFRMGFEHPGARYNGFAGQPEAIYSRLVAMAGVMNLDGNADIYGRITRDLLQLVCYAPSGPPRSFDELRKRLTLKWLRDTYLDDPFEKEVVSNERELMQRLEGVQLRLRPLIREFTPLTGLDGFTVEQTNTAIFSLRTQSMSDSATYFLQFLIEDLKDFIGKRQRRPAVLVIDEFGAFGNQNIIKLLSLARSAKLGIVLATQDVANLGDETTMRSILANTGTKLLMRSDFPEDIASLAGTIYQLENSVQYDQGQATGLGSVRPQHTFKIDMNEAAQLRPGEGFLIRHRQTAKLKIAALDEDEVAALVQDTPPEIIQPAPPRRQATTEQPADAALPPRKRRKQPKNID